jgi:hypothetical protein
VSVLRDGKKYLDMEVEEVKVVDQSEDGGFAEPEKQLGFSLQTVDRGCRLGVLS